MITAAGAPIHQGRQQGEAQRLSVRSAIDLLRGRYGRVGWWWRQREIRWGAGREMECFTPQQHERLQGIARGAEVSQAALELHETLYRIVGAARHDGARLSANFEVGTDLEALLMVRHSLPDAGGFPSVELSCAPWAGCLAGVNHEGIGAVCIEDRNLKTLSLRVLTQDVLFRARELSPAIDHLRSRAKYMSVDGRILVATSDGTGVVLHFRRGVADVLESAGTDDSFLQPVVAIDCKERELRWFRRDGQVETLTPTLPPE